MAVRFFFSQEDWGGLGWIGMKSEKKLVPTPEGPVLIGRVGEKALD